MVMGGETRRREHPRLHAFLALILLQSTATWPTTNGWITRTVTSTMKQQQLQQQISPPWAITAYTSSTHSVSAGGTPILQRQLDCFIVHCVNKAKRLDDDDGNDDSSTSSLRQNGIFKNGGDNTPLTPAQISLNAYVNKIKAELQQESGMAFFDTNEGRACVGEPSVDPSKMIDPNQGDSEWMDDW